MLKVITSLSFLYGITIILLVLYGIWYYRDFVRSAWHRKRFPFVFLAIGVACFTFLWVNIHAPLKLQTFSNLDHHFIRQDGFIVTRNIVLGKSDTVNFNNNSFSSFVLEKKDNQVKVISSYSEDPFYAGTAGTYQVLSTTYPAEGHSIIFKYDSIAASIRATDNNFELSLNGHVFATNKQVKKGSALWNIVKDEPSFVNSAYYNHEELTGVLKNVFVVRNNVSKKTGGELKYFISGRVFQFADKLSYDQQSVQLSDLRFEAVIPDKSNFAWGIGFLDNNKNQFRLQHAGNDSFFVFNRYPVSYPLSEENNTDWSSHGVSKFLLSDQNDMLNMPEVFREGFLFSAFEHDSTSDFAPVLLTYQKAAANKPLQLKAQWQNAPSLIELSNDELILPAKLAGFSWKFSIRNTFNWEYGANSLTAGLWQWLLFGSLFFFFALVLLTSLIIPADKLSWVWQLLSSVTIVLLTTRFFLYWRYKSFPPYEGMDLPSQQQLYSFWNFGIIIASALLLAIVFGFGSFRYIYSLLRKKSFVIANPSLNDQSTGGFTTPGTISRAIRNSVPGKRFGVKAIFFISWFLLLGLAATMAFARNFDPGTCRHLAIGLMILYFIYVFISYRHSPLVKSAEESWWRLNTSTPLHIIVSNPVKVLLSISLLAIFVFIDIGFAIVFLNFLLFNEAFLCINYAIAGLSAGSRRNAGLFAASGCIYLLAFILNLLYAPYIFKYLLNLPQALYFAGYVFFSVIIAWHVVRLFDFARRKNIIVGLATTLFFFVIAFFFFPKEKIIEKAAMTKYRIDVLTMPVGEAIELAYNEGKTYEPVIRAAQNQWFINTLIYEKNNPAVQSTGFHLLPHAPQNKGAKYNAQATDLVASRFLLAEHGKWSVLLYVLLLILPTTMLASFYKLYPDFTNRINDRYPVITAGFSVLNYLLITALLVILAATGRYIFFGQDLPFGSILSKQSILFPSVLIITAILLFKNIAPEYYANRKKLIPGIIVFVLLGVLLFFVKPVFNKDKEFNVEGLASDLDAVIQLRLQPVLDHFDTSVATRRFSMARKDRLFTDSVKKLIAMQAFDKENDFFVKEITNYTRLDFPRHLEQSRLLYLDLYSGRPQLAVNENYFRIEPPPHLQQSWSGNVFSDSSIYNIVLSDAQNRSITRKRLSGFTSEPDISLTDELTLSFRSPATAFRYTKLYLVNKGPSILHIKCNNEQSILQSNDSIKLYNPTRIIISDSAKNYEKVLTAEPDAFMKNFYVNGSRFYVYPMSSRFIWARNFAESIATDYTEKQQSTKNAFISLDFELMDSLGLKIRAMMNRDTAYKKGAEYGICIADGNGRLIAMADFIKDFARPDPNNKAGFNSTIMGENGFVSQSLLRKQIGNINLLRLNPGPGSTLKPIVFSAIASQLNIDWDVFSAEGFSGQQEYFGGEKVAKYDFEKDNGKITTIRDYLKYSDNYYHSNVLLLGSYPKQNLNTLLSKSFVQDNPGDSTRWPWFNYKGEQYLLDGYENWPGYVNGKSNFGMDSSFTSVGLSSNYGINTRADSKHFDMFLSPGNTTDFSNALSRSGFVMPEYPLFDQQGSSVDKRIPYDVFANCFRGHVKGSSQVMIPPVKMVEAFGRMISQSRNYSLTLDPYASAPAYSAFAVDNTIVYNNYLSIIREGVFSGLKDVLTSGTAARLGSLLPKAPPSLAARNQNGNSAGGSKYHYYAKTGTTGDNEVKTKSKLMAVIISEKDITDPGFNFRNNKFYTIYFTLQNGPAKQNEEFQSEIIRYIERSASFTRYMTK